VRARLQAVWLLVFAHTLPATAAHAQSGKVLELQAPVEEFSGPILGLTFPVETAAPAVQGLDVRETASAIHVELPADILFDFDKAEIRPSAAQALHKAAELIRTRAVAVVRVEGHTDAKGGAAYNQRLSERRANAVRLWLVQRENLSSVKFVTAGFGARRPVAPNRTPNGSDDPAGRQRNRRVELVLLKH
jgi:outer membrane protein OmpA-like peptidoglycan-associated protein